MIIFFIIRYYCLAFRIKCPRERSFWMSNLLKEFPKLGAVYKIRLARAEQKMR